MKKSSYSRCNQIVSTLKKSTVHVPLCADELAPGCASPSADRSETGLPQPCAHGRRRNDEPQALQLADNPLITPTSVLSRVMLRNEASAKMSSMAPSGRRFISDRCSIIRAGE
jgi:hypothetical protein